MKRWILLSVLLLILSPARPIVPSADGHIPVVDFSGLRPMLSPHPDTVRVVNFWATWCIPCIKELPAFEKASQELEGQAVEFIFVSLDQAENLTSRVIPFLEKRQLRATHFLLDDPKANSWIPLVSKEWTGAIPATIVFRGGEAFFREGTLTYEELMGSINGMLDEK